MADRVIRNNACARIHRLPLDGHCARPSGKADPATLFKRVWTRRFIEIARCWIPRRRRTAPWRLRHRTVSPSRRGATGHYML